MHVRIAWEIYHHQGKQNPDKTAAPGIGVKTEQLLRPPSHIFSSAGAIPRPHEMPPTAFPPTGLPGRPFEASALASSFLGAPTSHLG